MTFLERFRTPPRRLDEIDSVIQNLANILNSKEGFASFLPAFGLGSYTGRPGVAGLVKDIAAELLHEAREFEPRLTDPAVKILDREGDLRLRFELSGRVGDKPISLLIVVHIAAGQAHIEAHR